MGDIEGGVARRCGVIVEIPPFAYLGPNSKREQCVVGSLTGVVASKRVTEASKGTSARLVTVRRVQWHKGA